MKIITNVYYSVFIFIANLIIFILDKELFFFFTSLISGITMIAIIYKTRFSKFNTSQNPESKLNKNV